MKSIRRHQMLVLVLGTLVIVALATLAHYVALRRSLTRQFDAVLATKAASLGTLLEFEPPTIEFDFLAETMPQYDPGPEAEYFQVWSDGEVLDRSASLGSGELPYRYGPPERPALTDLELPDGRPGRAIGVEFPITSEAAVREEVARTPTAVVVVARNREDLRGSLASLGSLLIVEGALICASICILVIVTIQHAIAPLHRMGEQVDAIDSATLDRRLDESELPEELRPIAAGLNRLLARLEAGFERERRTTANIAHELRTPVAELRTATEVAEKWENDAELASRTIATSHQIALEMERMVTSLLKLARIESGQAALCTESIDLARALDDCLSGLRPRAGQKNLSLNGEVTRGTVVHTDPDGLRMILLNLLANAVAHTPEGGWVRCADAVDGETVRLEISNLNETLAAEDLPHLAEPFWTKNAARSTSEHVGLGATLVMAVANRIGVGVSFAVDNDEFRATLEIPREARRS